LPNPYDKIAGRFAGARKPWLEQRYLPALIEGLAPGDRVLDLGCGAGLPITARLSGAGLRVIGVDSSIEMLRLARRNVPTALLVLADMTEVELQDGAFAAIVAWDSLFHVDRSDHRAMYGKFARWLRPGARVLFTSGGSGDAGFTSSMFGEEFFYSGYPPSEVASYLRAAGLTVLTQELDEPRDKGHVSFLAEKPSGELAW
jgi:cyclopropane fatty-acyl-phospholipid synthase-like methyltransferase